MYIHTDGLGSPVARTDKNGNLISRTRYEPYGATAAGATPTIGFTGHVNDPDTGLIYMQQRYYDPYAGRFLSTDPVLTDANTGGGFNRYVYANNNPLRFTDPDGRQAKGIEINCPVGNCTTYGGVNLDRVDEFLKQTRYNLIDAIPFIGPDLAKDMGADSVKILDPIQPIADSMRSFQKGNWGTGLVVMAGVIPPLKGFRGAKTIVEADQVVKKAESLKGPMAKAYEKLKDLLAYGKAGKNQHALTGDLKGKNAIDLAASGKGRGGDRVIYTETENEILIHDIVDYHTKK